MLSQGQGSFQMYEGLMEDLLSSSATTPNINHLDISHNIGSLLQNLAILKDKVLQLQALVSLVVSASDPPPPPPHHHHQRQLIQAQQHDHAAAAIAGAGALTQEIILAASSMLYAFQQVTFSNPEAGLGQLVAAAANSEGQTNYNHPSTTNATTKGYCSTSRIRCDIDDTCHQPQHSNTMEGGDDADADADGDHIIELDAADLLAKFTHYCEVCGKGFKRDANLRMHMRAHGEEYKTNAALMNSSSIHLPRTLRRRYRYSCPQEGCRWNKRHAKFQPLKSMVCVKNHYRRSHCPKMFVCKRCNRKQFSVLSDLRTHEKHCGDLRWVCSCGTTFSRKDKLMGHLALFIGHSPAATATATATAADPLPNG